MASCCWRRNVAQCGRSSREENALWRDLAGTIGDEIVDLAPTGALDALSAYEHEFGRARLVERLSDILLVRESQPGDAHREFCKIPFDIVCTTNLERQYELTPTYVYPVVDEDQLSLNTATPGTLLLKLHGDLHHPNRLIVTEADYDGFLTNYPLLATYLSNQLIMKTAVLVGYSLDDPDFRQLWHVVAERLGRTRRPAYTLMINARPGDIARYERRGIKVINLPGSRDRYGEILAAAFKELRDYMRDNVLSFSKVTEEQPLRELLLPRDAPTRLCFFAVPLELLPFYRDRVFPKVEEVGFVPITADEVISPGENVTAKIDSLIDRASVVVVEVASPWTLSEFRMAHSRLLAAQRGEGRPFHLIPVVKIGEPIPSEISALQVIHRPDLITGDPDAFISELSRMLQLIAAESDVLRAQEPRRLLEAKEYRAAIISAMTLLEGTLREQLDKPPWPNVRRPMSLRALVDQAVAHDVVSSESKERIFSWIPIRNAAVHTNKPVGQAKALEIVEGVFEIIGR